MKAKEKLLNDYTLANVRKKFGTFVVRALQVGHDKPFLDGERIIVCTTSDSVRGDGGTGFLDFAITVEQAVLLRECLDDILRSRDRGNCRVVEGGETSDKEIPVDEAEANKEAWRDIVGNDR